MSDPRSLEMLLCCVAGGDHAAFAELYDRTAARVFALAHRVLRNPSDSEEVAQDVYLDVWRRAAAFDPTRGSAISWVLMMAHARSVDKVRVTTAARNRILAQLREPAVPGVDAVTEHLMRAVDSDRVNVALCGLSPFRREALMYAFFSDHTYLESSRILDVPVGTFKSRVRDGLLALRGVLT